MNVKELKELLKDAPDDMLVLVQVENHIKPGMFAFTEACVCDSGVSTLGPGIDEEGGEVVFLVLPHGSGVPEDEMDDLENKSPALN